MDISVGILMEGNSAEILNFESFLIILRYFLFIDT